MLGVRQARRAVLLLTRGPPQPGQAPPPPQPALQLQHARALAAPAPKLTNTMTPAEIRTALLAPSFPVEKLTALLDHDNLEMRAEFRKFISEPVMVPRYNIRYDFQFKCLDY